MGPPGSGGFRGASPGLAERDQADDVTGEGVCERPGAGFADQRFNRRYVSRLQQVSVSLACRAQ